LKINELYCGYKTPSGITNQIEAFKSMDLKAFYFLGISEDIAVD